MVRRGETLSGIAQHYGVTVTALRNANGIDSGSVLKAGEKLNIPELKTDGFQETERGRHLAPPFDFAPRSTYCCFTSREVPRSTASE